MRYENDRYYHIVSVKNISVLAQTYNVKNNPDEFWEDFNNVPYFVPVAYSNCVNEKSNFVKIYNIFKSLDDNRHKYSYMNTPGDFVKKHIITDGRDNIKLCNKHLLRTSPGSSNNSQVGSHTSTVSRTGVRSGGIGRNQKPQICYTKDSWLRLVIKSLFPKIESCYKAGVTTNTPQWAIQLYAQTNKQQQQPPRQ